MKHFLSVFLILSLFVTAAEARKKRKKEIKYKKRCSIEKTMKPKCYHPRHRSELNIALMYYGKDMDESHLLRIKDLLVERFQKAVSNLIKLNVIDIKILDYKRQIPANYTFTYEKRLADGTEVPAGTITDPDRLERIYYGEHVRGKIMTEVYEEYKKVADPEILRKVDALNVITGAQFEGLGFATGRVSVTEYPREVAWARDYGRVEYPTDYEIVDELIHELGHNMFLGHAAANCQAPGLSYEERKSCCAASANKDDVMSYCRDRSSVSEDKMFKFESCNMGMIKRLVIPAMLKGRRWNVEGRVRCR